METKELFLHHAKLIFADLGFHGASMGNIAKASGKNKATLYHYFKSKNELYYEILDATFVVFNETLNANIQAQSSYEKQIRSFIKTLIELDILTARTIYRLTLDGVNNLPSSIKESFDLREKIFAKIFKNGIANGEFKMMNPKNIYYFLVGSCFEYIFEFCFNKQIENKEKFDKPNSEFIDELSTIILDAIALKEDIVL